MHWLGLCIYIVSQGLFVVAYGDGEYVAFSLQRTSPEILHSTTRLISKRSQAVAVAATAETAVLDN